jgi:hypothetical protein
MFFRYYFTQYQSFNFLEKRFYQVMPKVKRKINLIKFKCTLKQTEFYKSILVITLPPLKVGFLENGQDTGKRAPMACAMIYWGNNQDRFYEVFIEYGAVVDISNLIGKKVGADGKKYELFQ